MRSGWSVIGGVPGGEEREARGWGADRFCSLPACGRPPPLESFRALGVTLPQGFLTIVGQVLQDRLPGLARQRKGKCGRHSGVLATGGFSTDEAILPLTNLVSAGFQTPGKGLRYLFNISKPTWPPVLPVGIPRFYRVAGLPFSRGGSSLHNPDHFASSAFLSRSEWECLLPPPPGLPGYLPGPIPWDQCELLPINLHFYF